MNFLKRLAVLLALVLLTRCKKDEPAIKIPDSLFMTTLVELGIDKNNDLQISSSEAEAVTSLNIYGKEITDITGINAFTNLDSLTCSFNNLSTLDVSGLSKLIYLDCGMNPLSSLDVSNNTLLIELWCNYCNTISELNVSGNKLLTTLFCRQNSLSDIDLSNCPALIRLYCSGNNLEKLDIT